MTTYEAIHRLKSAYPGQTVSARKELWCHDTRPEIIDEDYKVSVLPINPSGQILLITGASLDECVTKATAHLTPSEPNNE